jgi:hypothetical protein
MNAQIKSALAVEVLAFRNEQSQQAFLRQDASKALIRLLKVCSQCSTKQMLDFLPKRPLINHKSQDL